MLSASKSSLLDPPRLLAGVTLLYWGAMIGEALVALILAIVLESKNWVKWRWDFDAAAYVKAFQLSLGLLGLVLFLVWLNEVSHNSLFQVIKWFPVYFLPVELAQRYGKGDKMNLNTFFYFSRQRMRQDIKEGRSVNPKSINTGYPYLFGVIVVASCSGRMDVYVHVTMLALMATVISSASVKQGMNWKRLVWAVPVMLLMAVWVQSETDGIYRSYAARAHAFNSSKQEESSPAYSALGQLGNIKQNPEIRWRMWGDDVPKYLRMNSYNNYYGAGWNYDYKSYGFETMDAAFADGTGTELSGEDNGVYVFDAEHETMLDGVDTSRRQITLRGMGQSDTVESIVPSVAGLFAISEMAGDDVIPSVHPLGVLKLTNRKSIIDYQLWFTEYNILDGEPDEKLDLAIHEKCKAAVVKLSDEMQLSNYSFPYEKVNAIRNFFMQEFTYALHFEVSRIDYKGSDLERFMLDDRRGHCEYFATAATLLLRQQGIPTRYCVGYVASEKNADTWIMRGSHAHAWCSAWIDGKWEIVDLTPPDWLALQSENDKPDWAQGFKDWFQNVKQDFLIWRAKEENQSLMNLVIWVLGVILLAWFGYRLFRVRTRQTINEEVSDSLLVYKVPRNFELIEVQLSSVVGTRSISQTYSSWVNNASSKLDKILSSRLADLVALHEQSRFGGVDRSQEITKLSKKIQSLLKK